MTTTMKNLSFEAFSTSKKIKLTSLRKDILFILFNKNKPMGAYEILEKLKKKRNNAEPMTVYRVLKQLVNAKLIHKIESQNVYVCCTKPDIEQNSHKTILLLCKNCRSSSEFEDNSISRSIKKFVEKHQMEMDDTPIEIHGLCHKCLQTKNIHYKS